MGCVRCRVSELARVLALASAVLVLPGSARAEVTAVRGDECWRITTGAIEAVIDDRNYVRSLRLPGGPELMAEGGGYWDLVYQPDGGDARHGQYTRFGHHVPVVAEVVHRSEGRLHLCVRTDESRRDPGNAFHVPLLQEVHYVFEAGLPGFYLVGVLRHPTELPALELHQARHVMRCNQELFDAYRLSDHRAGDLAPWEQFRQAETIADATFRLPNGRIVTKYQYSRALSEGPAWGLVSENAGTGLWAIEPSHEYCTGGPTKQNLTVQNGALLLNEPLNGHYMGPSTGLHVDGAWARVIGPWLYYVNAGRSREELWADAVARAEMERRRWPYRWCAHAVGEALYPLERGAVRGRVTDAEGRPAQGAWVILGGVDGNWQGQSDGYRFWARTDADGAFRIEKVRPGGYSLRAWRAGVPGEARCDDIAVVAGEELVAATIVLPTWGRDAIWQIGTPDRSAAEFRRGDDFRRWNILRFYPEDFPHDLTFVVGESEEREHWNIAQPGPTVLDDGTRVQHPWTVEFDLGQPIDAILTLGIADSSYHPPAGVAIRVNETELEELALAPGDSAAYRCGASGHYQVHHVAIRAAMLREGTNRIELNLPHRGSWVMYDFVALRHGD